MSSFEPIQVGSNEEAPRDKLLAYHGVLLLCSHFSLDKSIDPAGYIGGLAFVAGLFRMGKLKKGIGYFASSYIRHFGIIVNECYNCPVNSLIRRERGSCLLRGLDMSLPNI
ncbi:hypothetical protein FLT15_24055 [Paenibacillus thiaminolyticus]|uniref:hypothetical protein n=1 Tax=Paenibacillus thiaminolyticus TaxID=49283 RepID=UPI001161C7C6|nr:hypothetical protein [Paenibacillus thiaminolyticus]NGP61309.1 hypothetical protein [Paenibacillus thiaminolyticus]